MMREEQYADLMSAAEALLFVSDEPVSSAKLAGMVGVLPIAMDEALTLLSVEYEEENRGIQLREVAGGWRFVTHPAHHAVIEKYVLSWDTRKLSQAALEALAVIAYHQPVTRARVNAVRGVNSEAVISSLVEKGLVREVGREKTPGGAILYGTTRTFLERFGLKGLDELPPLEDFAPDEESRALIRERLSGAGAFGQQVTLDADEEGGTLLSLTREGVEVAEVDYGDDERVDDADAMARVVGEAITEKAAFEDDDIETIE